MKPRRILSDEEKIARSSGYVTTKNIDNVKRYILNGIQYNPEQGKVKIACPKALSETSFVTFDVTPDMLHNGKSFDGSTPIILPAGGLQIMRQKDGRIFEDGISSHDLAMFYTEQSNIEYKAEIKIPKREISEKNIINGMKLISDSKDLDYSELADKMDTLGYTWTTKDVKYWAEDNKVKGAENIEEGLRSGDMYSAASVVANAFSNSQGWDAVRQYAFLPGDANVDSWLSANRELDKELNADEYAQEWSPDTHILSRTKSDSYEVSINEKIDKLKDLSPKMTVDEILAKYRAAKEAQASKSKAVDAEFGDISKQDGATGPEASV